MSDLEWYAEASHSSLLYLTLEALGLSVVPEAKTSQAASHVGCCSGIVTLLRGFPYHLSHGIVHIPASIATKHKVNLKLIQSAMTSKQGLSAEQVHQLSAAVFDVASQAQGHLEEARYYLFTYYSNFKSIIPTTITTDCFFKENHQKWWAGAECHLRTSACCTFKAIPRHTRNIKI